MRITFHETFRLPAATVFSFFRSPRDWPRLYGMFGDVEDRAHGWIAVPLKGFPFPLVARVTECTEGAHVSWVFGGFWRGTGEVRLTPSDEGTTVEGYEDVSVRWLFGLSPVVEKLALERRFRGIWRHGWKRLRQLEAQP